MDRVYRKKITKEVRRMLMVDLGSWKNKKIEGWKEILMPKLDYPELVRLYEDNILKDGIMLTGIYLKFKRLSQLEKDEEVLRFNGNIILEKAITEDNNAQR